MHEKKKKNIDNEKKRALQFQNFRLSLIND